MGPTHLFDLPPEILVRILKYVDEQSLGRSKAVCRYLNSLIHRHRTRLARQMIYMAVFKEGELAVERYLRRSRWEDYKYALPGPYADEVTFRQIACADIETVRFQMHVPDEVAQEWAKHLAELKSSTFRVIFARCRMSVKALIMLLTALRPKQVSIEFGSEWEEVSIDKLCLHQIFSEIPHLSLVNSRISDGDFRLLKAQYLTVYEATGITVSGLNQILLDWYNGKRAIKDYHLSVSEMIAPDRLFDGLPTRRRSVVAWEIHNSDAVLYISIVGPGVSIVKVHDVLVAN